MHKIEIHRPYDIRGAFDADEHEGRRLIFEYDLTTNHDEQIGSEVAERVFRITNASNEMLSEEELEFASAFRDKDNYSLSIGDIVKVDGEYFLCESIGWKKLENPIYPLTKHA